MERSKPGYKLKHGEIQNLDIKSKHGEIQNLDIKSKHGEIKTWM